MPVTFDNRGFVKVRVNIRNNFPEALLAGADDVVNLAKQLAPEDTGELKESIKAVLTGNRTVQITAGEGLPDERAIAQEYGTVFMPAQPYLTPAMTAVDIMKHVREKLEI